ncbi:hypothetical protein D3C86_2143550 [compost metagenome]
MMTCTPLALRRFMMPWMLDERKLSEPAFMIRRYTPTVLGCLRRMLSAMKSLRVVFDCTIAWIRFCGTSR